MASFFEKITVAIDLQTAKASAGFRDLKTSISEAEGFTGKLKAGASGLKSSLGGLVSGLGPAGVAGAAAAAGAALWAAGEKFVNLGRQTRDLAIATGLSNDEASRLIDVFGDLGGDASSLASSIGKITKDLDADKWEKYGIATRDAGGEVLETNEIFLDALDTLRKIKDPTLRAAAGTELFGKSWANLAPLIAKSNAELEEMLANVADAKVMTDEEVKSAEDLAMAQDAIKDVVEDLTLQVGKLVASLAPLIPLWELSMKPLQYLMEGIGWASEKVGQGIGLVKQGVSELWDEMFGPSDREIYLEKIRKVAEDTPPVLVEVGDAGKEMAQKLYEAEQDAAALADTLANNRDSLARSAYEAESRIRALYDEIDQKKTWNELRLDILGVREEIDGLNKDLEDKKITAEEYGIELENIFLDGEQGILDFVETLDREVPTEVVTDLLADFRAGDVRGVLARLQSLVDQNPIAARLNVVGGQTSIPSSVRDGSITAGGTFVTVNMGVVGNPAEATRVIIKLLEDYGSTIGTRYIR